MNKMIEALERIAAYPRSRSEEMSIGTAREIARSALASQQQDHIPDGGKMVQSQAQQEAIGEVQHYAAPANLPAYVNVKWYGKPPKNGAKVYVIPPAPEGGE